MQATRSRCQVERALAVVLALAGVPAVVARERPALAARLAKAGLELEETKGFLAQLQAAVRTGDRPGVSALVALPFTTEVAGKKHTLRTRHELEAQYDAIFCPAVREVILGQRLEALFANYKGVMIGRGEVWFAGVCLDRDCREHRVRIIAVNGPFRGGCEEGEHE